MLTSLATLGNTPTPKPFPDLTVLGLVPGHLGTVLSQVGLVGPSSSLCVFNNRTTFKTRSLDLSLSCLSSEHSSVTVQTLEPSERALELGRSHCCLFPA